VGTSSRLLYEVLSSVYDDLGFDVVGDETFKNLVIGRVVEPTSILRAGLVWTDLGIVDVPVDKTMRRSLRRAIDRDYRGQLASQCFANAQTSGDVTLCLFDVTTLRTHSQKGNDFLQSGFSKDHSPDPQVVVGLLVDRFGNPLEIRAFEGSMVEQRTMLPVICDFKARHALESIVIVADAGMLIADNLEALDKAGFGFIVGSKSHTKGPGDLDSHFRWFGDAFTDGQIIDTLTPKKGANLDNDKTQRAEPVWDRAAHPGSFRAVWQYRHKRYIRDIRVAEEQEERARKIVDGEKPGRATKFVTVTKTSRTVNEAAIARAKKMAGLKGYVSNIPATVMTPAEIIDAYHELWHVEQSFRMSKSDLQARPFFVRREDSINAHLTVVFAALAVAREAQHRTGRTIRSILNELRPLRSSTLAINNVIETFPPGLAPDQQALVDDLLQARH
jgi:hypothetical protein